jgi:hypothetical protein
VYGTTVKGVIFCCVFPHSFPVLFSRSLCGELEELFSLQCGSVDELFPGRFRRVKGEDKDEADAARKRARDRAEGLLDHVASGYFKAVRAETAAGVLRRGLMASFAPCVAARPLAATLQLAVSTALLELCGRQAHGKRATMTSVDGSLVIPVGACMFFDGELISTTLPARDTRDVAAFLWARGLFGRGGSRSGASFEEHLEVASTTSSPDGTLARMPRGLSVVARKGMVVAALLKSRGTAKERASVPDQDYIHAARHVLDVLERAGVEAELRVEHPPALMGGPGKPGAVAEESASAPSLNLTGRPNPVFHYASMNTHTGTILLPAHLDSWASQGDAATLREVFFRSCASLRALLHGSSDPVSLPALADAPAAKPAAGARAGSQSSASQPRSDQSVRLGGMNADIFAPRALAGAEHEASLRVKVAGESFWIVGRLMSSASEFYVCHHASVPQAAVEQAFRLHWGT